MTTNEKAQLKHVLTRQCERLERKVARLQRAEKRYSMTRLSVISASIPLMVWAAQLFSSLGLWGVLLTAIAAFMVLMVAHERVEKSRKRHSHLLEIMQAHVARMAHDWENIPLPSEVKPMPEHPFERDFVLSGERSLLHLIDTTTSAGGSERLRSWLFQPLQNVQQIRERQRGVKALIPLAGFCRKLALYGSFISRTRWGAESVEYWLQRDVPSHSLVPFTLVLALFAVCNIALFALWQLGITPAWWLYSFAVYVLIYGGVYVAHFSFLHGFANAAVNLKYALENIEEVLLYLEHSPHTNKGELARLCEPLHHTGMRPSEWLRSLRRIVVGASLQNQTLFWIVLNALVPWNLFFYDRLTRYNKHLQKVLPVWLDRVYEMEALAALAQFAWLNPHYSFPKVHDAVPEMPLVEMRGVGHPLLPDDHCVNNDYTAHNTGDVAIITGSNMSGKSTFLRTVGINLVLAHCGSVVAASVLHTVPLRMFSSMAVSDSVVDGISFFYAEVRRLKLLLSQAQSSHHLPLFFFIDEIFRGTNNRERLAGSRAFVRALAQCNAVGMVSTHDLELVHLSEENAAITNYHFRENVEHGRMVFDYLLKPGPCPTTNALTIMALEGLPVE